MRRTTKQNARLHYLLNRLHIADMKDMLAHTFSNGRTESTSELSVTECEALINHLAAQLPGHQPAPETADKLRKKILSICHQLGWYRRELDGRLMLNQRTGKPMLDYARIDAFCRSRGKYKKGLNQHTTNELQVLIGQFNALFQNTVQKAVK